MKKGMKRIIAFFMAVLMVLTMADWGGISTVAKAGTTTRVYFQKPTDWGSVTLFTWNGSENHSYTMTSMSASSDSSIYWYYADVTDYTGNFNMIFQYNNWSAQTVNIEGVTAGGTYVYQPNGTSGSNINVIAGDTVRVYYNNPNNWSNLKIHFWANASYGPVSTWNKMAMTSAGNGWYYYDVPVVATDSEDGFSVIFTDGTNQTSAISVSTGNSSEAYTVNGTNVTAYSSISAAESAIGTGSGSGGGNTGGNTGSGSADFETSASGNMVYCYAPDYSGETLTLKYQTNGSNDNKTATAEAIARCPGWYVAEIQNTIWFVEFQCNGYPKFGKGSDSTSSQYFSPITSTSGNLLILTAVGSSYNTYTNGTTAVNALGLTTGYPGNPNPETFDVWYYNPNWTDAVDVVMYYKSTLVSSTKSIAVKSFGSEMPGWFYVDGSANGVYINNSVNTISQISFAAAGGLTSATTWTGSDAVIANATTEVYLSDTTAYATVEELIAAENPEVSPLSNTIVTMYSSKDLTGATVSATQNGTTKTATVTAGAESGQYVVEIPLNASVENYTCALTKTGIKASFDATSINTILNLDTGVSYASWTDLENGLASALTFTNGTAAPTNVTATVVMRDYATGEMGTETVTLTLVEQLATGSTYVASVPTDASELGYTLNYNYDGKTHISRINTDTTTIDLSNISENLIAYFYNGVSGDGVASEFKPMWSSVYADIYYYPANSSTATSVNDWKACTYVGNGWWSVDTGLDATSAEIENGIFIKFKDGSNGNNSTKAFQFLNNYRVFATAQMSIFKSAEKALQVLKETEQDLPEDNTGSTTVWFYHPGGWDSYNLKASTDGASANYTTAPMTKEEGLTNGAGGYWYHAAVPAGTKYVYFSDSTGANKTAAYNISANTASEIFCAASTDVISTGWSTSPAEIAKFYGLVNYPSTNEISLPITILDYNKDDVFFEYDADAFRAMTFVLANANVVANLGVNTNLYIDEAYVIDGNGNDNNRPGNVPYFDRNGNEYVTGILEKELVNGNPVYTEKAVTYVAKIIQAYCNIANIEQGKASIFQHLQPQNWQKSYTDAQWAAEYDAAVAKYSNMSAAQFAAYDIMSDNDLSVMDYAYYVMNNFYNTNSKLNQDFNMYSYLVLKKTSPNVYGFYANYSTDKTADYLDQNYGVKYIPKADGSGKIYNSDSGEDRGGFFPYDGDLIYNTLGQAATDSAEYINTHNYHYSMRASGKFQFDEEKDLYFTFTGDDDVVLYINGKIALDLSGAHRSASYTVYLSDLNDQGFNLVDGAYYDFDFFYMERHTDYANLRIETNIDPIDTAGKVQKYAYEDKNGDGVAETRIPSGAYREDKTRVVYEFELTAPSKDGLQNLTFTDPSLGVTITPDSIELGSYVNAAGETVNRSISELEVMVGTATYKRGTLTEDTLKAILKNGIQAGERITINGFKHVLNEGITGTVTAEGDGIEASDQHITTTDTHTININKPSITVTKTAADSEGNNLPEGSVLQAGETATYTMTLTNSGNSPLTDLTIVDEDLQFSVTTTKKANGDGTTNVTAEVKLNEYTKPADIKFTLLGTGSIDGIYQITPSTNGDPEAAALEDQAALNELAAKLTQIIYTTGASLSVSGINYPIVTTFPSTVEGTAHYLTEITSTLMEEIVSYGKAYVESKKNGTAEPNVNDYVRSVTDDTRDEVNTYIAAYKARLAATVNGEDVDLMYAPDYGFTVSDGVVRGQASLTLNAKLSAYTYYTEVGQAVEISLGGMETELKSSAASAQLGTTELSAGAHVIALWNHSNAAITVSKITLSGSTTVTLNVADSSNVFVKDANGNVISGRISGGTATLQAGETLVFDVADIAAGTYAVSVNYSTGTNADVVLVVDREPGNYVLTDINGTPYTASGNTYTVDGATITVDNSGAYPEITYTASKTGIQVFGILEEGASEGTIPDTVTVKNFDVADNVYVLDYGLKVELTDASWKNGLFQNDQITASAGETTTVLGAKPVDVKLDKTNGYVYKYVDNTYAALAEGKYGSVTTDGTDASATVTYSLNKFLEGIDRYTYGVQVGVENVAAADRNVTNSTPVMEANVTIMPATVVYYEDNFASVMTNGTANEGDSDREQSNGLDTQYGYDDAYKNDGEYSNNGYTALANAEKLAFTFQGTGFDILTRTAQANLKITVYDAEKFEIKVYTFGAGETGIAVARKDGVAATENALKNFTINAAYENGTLDQVPLISVDMEAYGKYIVLAQKTGTEEALHVDGIRIYNPIIVDDEVSDAYDNAKGEEGAVIREIRNMIFGEGYVFDFQNPSDPSTVVLEAGKDAVAGLVQMVGDQLNITTGNTIIESYTGSVNSADIAKNPASTSSLLGYAVSGPNNELYLTGEEYAFGAVINGITADSMIQIGLKAISDSTTVQYKAADGSWKDITDASNLTASIEMYYKLDVADLWKCNGKTVLLVRVSNGTASLTNLKYNGVSFEKITADALGATVIEDENTSSFNVISSSVAGSNAMVTFSVKNTVADFTVADAEGKIVFTYGTGEALPEGIVVRARAGEDFDIYVVKMPKTAGTYTIYTSAGTEFGTAQFTVE